MKQGIKKYYVVHSLARATRELTYKPGFCPLESHGNKNSMNFVAILERAIAHVATLINLLLVQGQTSRYTSFFV